MSTTGLSFSNNLNLTNATDKISLRKQYSQDLANNIESGNISEAKQTFSKLLQANLNSSQTNSTINQDFKGLESALSSGDISSVKSAFATLQRDTQSSDSSLSDSLRPSNLSIAQQAYSSIETFMRMTNQSQDNSHNTAKKINSSIFGVSA
jgi:hypothetical protein